MTRQQKSKKAGSTPVQTWKLQTKEEDWKLNLSGQGAETDEEHSRKEILPWDKEENKLVR